MIISWFSCGVTSAVATKLAIEKFGEKVKPIYFKIDQVHSDNERFISQCEEWYGCKIEQIQGEFKTPIEVALKHRYVNGPNGARCTMELKKKLRQKVEREREIMSLKCLGLNITKKRFYEQKDSLSNIQNQSQYSL